MSPRVLFEPIGEEIEVGEEETVLEAAFRQGYNLAYGCREGQCSACKCFLLEGEVDLLPYSTFALSESEEARRSFSMANLPGDGLIELMIKCYPGGRFSGLLEGSIHPGDTIQFTGPYGAFHLRSSRRPVLMLAGGSGMAPILSLLRQLADEHSARLVR